MDSDLISSLNLGSARIFLPLDHEQEKSDYVHVTHPGLLGVKAIPGFLRSRRIGALSDVCLLGEQAVRISVLAEQE